MTGIGEGNMAVAAQKEKLLVSDFTDNQTIIVTEKLGKLPPKRGYRFCKRVLDFLFALILLVILTLPLLILAPIVWIDTKGSPIYRQKRLGLNGKPFTLLKIRSMRADAEKDGIQWAATDDPRITRFGKILRATRMDELPQMWNILIGQMSFVGPRPERPEFYDAFDTYIDGFRQRLLVKPGLTGHAQVNGGYDLLPEEKIVYDLEYIKNRSLKFDFKCIWETIAVVLGKKGAH
ncbi:MAG: sugar transferase [Ruminococcaceae bacterium]|nr:sugar transferase [Oscillospiraceae bacterium]